MTKTDIKKDEEFENIYKNAGYKVLDKIKDIDEIKNLFRDKVCVLCGNSGVGKSTLINEISEHLCISGRIDDHAQLHEERRDNSDSSGQGDIRPRHH